MFTRYFTVWLLRMHTIADFFFFPTSPFKKKIRLPSAVPNILPPRHGMCPLKGLLCVSVISIFPPALSKLPFWETLPWTTKISSCSKMLSEQKAPDEITPHQVSRHCTLVGWM